MSHYRKLTALVAPLLLVLATACSLDAPTQAPPARPNPLLGELVGTVDGTVGGVVGGIAPQLLACPTTESYAATKRVGPGGGVIVVGPHSLLIPPGALAADTTITATAPAGDHVA